VVNMGDDAEVADVRHIKQLLIFFHFE
jgi:hypothetical protein